MRLREVSPPHVPHLSRLGACPCWDCCEEMGEAGGVQSEFASSGEEVHAPFQTPRAKALQAYWRRWGSQRYYRGEGVGEAVSEDEASHLSTVDSKAPTDEGGGDVLRRLEAYLGWLCAHHVYVPDRDMADLIQIAERAERPQTWEDLFPEGVEPSVQFHAKSKVWEMLRQLRFQEFPRPDDGPRL